MYIKQIIIQGFKRYSTSVVSLSFFVIIILLRLPLSRAQLSEFLQVNLWPKRLGILCINALSTILTLLICAS